MTLGGRIPQSLSLPVSYSVSQNGYVMNMRILTFTSLILASTATFAGQRCPANRCPVSVCSTTICEPTGNVAVCGATDESRLSYSSGPTTKLFMGKDGTIREVMTHWEALHRAVEAEQLETDLVAVRSELETATVDLTATKTELAALKEQSAIQVAALQQALDALKQKMGQQTKVASNQKARAEKAEVAQKAAADEAVKLKTAGEEAAKLAQQNLAKVEGNLKQTAEERDSLKVANENLQKEVKQMVAARTKAEEEITAAQIEIQKMKQEAIESKKTQVAKNAEDSEAPADGGDAPAEQPNEEAPATEENNLRISRQ
jgi:hypothetical protein